MSEIIDFSKLLLVAANLCNLRFFANKFVCMILTDLLAFGYKLHLLQKKALRLVDNSHYIAHTDPIFKKLHMVKIIDMFNIAVWKFYFKLMNNLLPP